MPKELNTRLERSALGVHQSRITNYELRITDHLSDDLHFLIACCQAEPTQKDIDFISSYLSQSETDTSDLHPARHPREGGDPQSPSDNTPSSLLTLANRHGIIPLVYKTLKRLSEEGLLRDTSDVNRNTNNFHPSRHPRLRSGIHSHKVTRITNHELRITKYYLPSSSNTWQSLAATCS